MSGNSESARSFMADTSLQDWESRRAMCDKRAKLRQLKSGGKYEKIENEYANDT